MAVNNRRKINSGLRKLGALIICNFVSLSGLSCYRESAIERDVIERTQPNHVLENRDSRISYSHDLENSIAEERAEFKKLYREYYLIDVDNLSPEQLANIKKFREKYPHGIDLGKVSESERKMFKHLDRFIDIENPADRDIIFFYNIFGGDALTQ